MVEQSWPGNERPDLPRGHRRASPAARRWIQLRQLRRHLLQGQLRRQGFSMPGAPVASQARPCALGSCASVGTELGEPCWHGCLCITDNAPHASSSIASQGWCSRSTGTLAGHGRLSRESRTCSSTGRSSHERPHANQPAFCWLLCNCRWARGRPTSRAHAQQNPAGHFAAFAYLQEGPTQTCDCCAARRPAVRSPSDGGMPQCKSVWALSLACMCVLGGRCCCSCVVVGRSAVSLQPRHAVPL